MTDLQNLQWLASCITGLGRHITGFACYCMQPNCWNCGEEGLPTWQCTKLKDKMKAKVRVTDMPEEDILALARIGLEVVEEEQESRGKDF
jgi:hypothetical protein